MHTLTCILGRKPRSAGVKLVRVIVAATVIEIVEIVTLIMIVILIALVAVIMSKSNTSKKEQR